MMRSKEKNVDCKDLLQFLGLLLLSAVAGGFCCDFSIGLPPSTLMLVVWGVMQITYMVTCIRMNRRAGLR